MTYFFQENASFKNSDKLSILIFILIRKTENLRVLVNNTVTRNCQYMI